MLENWNTALDNVRSRWVSIVGDDDVLDPNLYYFLKKVEIHDPTVESVRWQSAKAPVISVWNGETITSAVKVPLGVKQFNADNELHLNKLLNWDTFPNVPQKLSGLYHGAVKMDLLRSLKAQRGSWFKYHNVDFEIGWLISRQTKFTFFSQRPFSINGASPESNSWGVRRPSVSKRNIERAFNQGLALDGWSETFIESFLSAGGDTHFFYMMPVTVFGTTLKFHDEFLLNVEDSTKINFAKVLIYHSYTMDGREAFEWYLSNLDIFLPLFFSRHVKYEKPTLTEFYKNKVSKSGLVGDELRFARNMIPGNYEDLARFILSILAPVD